MKDYPNIMTITLTVAIDAPLETVEFQWRILMAQVMAVVQRRVELTGGMVRTLPSGM